jgi:hypothetical protein
MQERQATPVPVQEKATMIDLDEVHRIWIKNAKIREHHEGCWRWHAECAIQALANELAQLKAAFYRLEKDGWRMTPEESKRCQAFPGGEQCGREYGHEGKHVWLRGD